MSSVCCAFSADRYSTRIPIATKGLNPEIATGKNHRIYSAGSSYSAFKVLARDKNVVRECRLTRSEASPSSGSIALDPFFHVRRIVIVSRRKKGRGAEIPSRGADVLISLAHYNINPSPCPSVANAAPTLCALILPASSLSIFHQRYKTPRLPVLRSFSFPSRESCQRPRKKYKAQAYVTVL